MKKIAFLGGIFSCFLLVSCMGEYYPKGCEDGVGLTPVKINNIIVNEYEKNVFKKDYFYSCDNKIYFKNEYSILSPSVNKIDYSYISDDLKGFKVLNLGVVKDSENIYMSDSKKWIKLEGFNVDTFEYLGFGFYKDKEYVYKYNLHGNNFLKVIHVDVDTFEVISIDYSRDKNHTYETQISYINEKEQGFIFKETVYELNIVDKLERLGE